MLDLHYEKRASKGLRCLSVPPALVDVARKHPEGMIERCYFFHTSPDGEAAGARLKRSAINIVPPARTSPGGLPPRAPRTTLHQPDERHRPQRQHILNKNSCGIGIGAAKGVQESYGNATMRPPTSSSPPTLVSTNPDPTRLLPGGHPGKLSAAPWPHQKVDSPRPRRGAISFGPRSPVSRNESFGGAHAGYGAYHPLPRPLY